MTAVACPGNGATPIPAAAPGQADAAGSSDVVLSVPGIRCAGCIRKIEDTLTALPGVSAARVNLTQKRVTVTTRLARELLIEALGKAGFKAEELDRDRLPEADREGSALLFRLGLAGFAMMNVMLLSVAVWSGAEAATRDLFHLISAAIAVPVVAISGQPFFRSALGALSKLRLNMDVPISLAILLATVMSVYEALSGGEHAYFDAALSLTFFLLVGRYLDHRARGMARSAAAELSALEVHRCKRRIGRSVEEVAVAELAIGDTVLVPSGQRFPVDGVVQAATLTDRAFLTGESDPVPVAAGAPVRAGEINIGAPVELVATAVGADTTLRRIAALVDRAENARTRYTMLADRAAAIYAPGVHLLALFTFVGWLAASGDLRTSLNVAIAVLIITCPCALGLAVPAVSTAAISRLYGLGFLVTSGSALERLAEIDTVVFDKTGTLTEPGIADLPQFTTEEAAIGRALASHSNHPIAKALARALAAGQAAPLTDIVEVPGEGVRARDGTGRPVALGRSGTGLALTIGSDRWPLTVREQIRHDAPETVADLEDRGLFLHLLTGDTRTKAEAAGRALGITSVWAGVLPEDKQGVIGDLQADGSRVLMVGDGLNDTASLASAHAAIAPASALDATRQAADGILLADRLAIIPAALDTAKKSVRLSKQNFAIAAAYNAIAIPIAVAGLATPLLAALAMSASSITVLLNALRARKA